MHLNALWFVLKWDCKGPLLCEFLGRGERINSDHCILTLGKLKDAIWKTHPHLCVGGHCSGPFMVRHKFLLHYNKAPWQVSVPTLAKLDELGMEMVPHRPYSPYLALCDFSILPKLKDALCSHSFSTLVDWKTGTLGVFNSFHKQVFTEAIADLTICWAKRVKAHGEYFERCYISVDTKEVEYA